MWKSTLKNDHAEQFSVKLHTKNQLILLSQMHVFLPLGGISVTKWWNVLYRAGFKLKVLHNEVFIALSTKIWVISHQKLAIFKS